MITWQCYTFTFNLGEAYSAAGNNVEAENWYKASLKSKPDHMAVHLTYAKHLAKIVSTWSVLISILCCKFFSCCLSDLSRDDSLSKLISKTLDRIVISLGHVANVLDLLFFVNLHIFEFPFFFYFHMSTQLTGFWEVGRAEVGVLWDVTGSTVGLEPFLGSWNNLGKKVLPLPCKFLETLCGSSEHE